MKKPLKKMKRSMPAVSTASLPDIVFMLLFFFMVTTVMREVILKVKLKKPQATEAVRLENRALVDHIYIGEPLSAPAGEEPFVLQLNDDFATVSDISAFIEESDQPRSERDQRKVVRSLKVDENAMMGLVSDVKLELRKANALRISYATETEKEGQ